MKIDYSKCTGCGDCIDICTVSAIYKSDRVYIDNSRCIKCRMCLITCLNRAIKL